MLNPKLLTLIRTNFYFKVLSVLIDFGHVVLLFLIIQSIKDSACKLECHGPASTKEPLKIGIYVVDHVLVIEILGRSLLFGSSNKLAGFWVLLGNVTRILEAAINHHLFSTSNVFLPIVFKNWCIRSNLRKISFKGRRLSFIIIILERKVNFADL